MLKYILDFFIERKLLVNLLIIIIVLFGLFSLQTLKREAMPEVDLYELSYTTIYPGASPEDVELKVTIPLEDAIKGVDGLKEYSSVSYENVSSIRILLEDALSVEEAEDAKSDIQKAIDRVVDLPAEIAQRPKLFEVKMTKLPIIEIALAHPDSIELRRIAKYLEDKLDKMSEVSEVKRVGYLDQEVKISLDPYKLIDTETPINDVINGLNGRNIRLSGGTLESYSSEKAIITDEELRDVDDVKDVIIRSSFGGKSLRLNDVGKVSKQLEGPDYVVRSNGITGISLSIVKKENADVIRTIDKIKDFLEEEKKGLSKELTIDFVNDESIFTRNRVKIVLTNAVIGIVLVALSLKMFLDFSTAMWTAFGIPFALLIAFVFLRWIGVSINPLSLGGFIIVIGMLVDDAIVVAENIKRHKEEGSDNIQAVKDGAREVALPVITTITTTVLAFLPLVFVSGIMGKFMKIIPMIVIVTLSASLFESLFILPSHLSHGKGHTKKYVKKAWVKRLEDAYKSLLTTIMGYRYLFLVGIALFFVGSMMFAAKTFKFEMLPEGDVDTFYVRMESSIGTSLEKMTDQVMDIEKLVATLPKDEVLSYGTRVGHDSEFSYTDTGTHPHLSIIYVYLSPAEERNRLSSEIIADLQAKVLGQGHSFKKITFEKKNYGPPVGKPVSAILVGDNDTQRNAAGKELYQYVSSLEGVIDPRNNLGERKQAYKLKIDHDKLARLGLSVYQVASTVRTAYEGMDVFSVRQENEDVQYRVVMDDKYRGKLDYLLELPVRNMMGKLVRLRQFAKLVKTTNVLEVNRYNGQRAYSLYADLNKKVLTSTEAGAIVKKYFDENLKDKYPSVSIVVSGEADTSNETMKSLGQTFIIAILGVYFMLVLLFNSVAQPLFVLSAVPFGLIGVIWAFFFHGQPMSMPAIMGFIGLSGVVVNDSLIMVDFINKTTDEEHETRQQFMEHIVYGAGTRLRPIILTSVTTILGLLPTVYGWGGTDFILVPMTMSMGYGLLFATVITLFIVPCLTMVHKDFVLLFSKKR